MSNPTPVKRESRICFGIKWFATEEEAMAYHDYVREKTSLTMAVSTDGMPVRLRQELRPCR